MEKITKEIFKKRLELLPPTFEIYITNQCNLNCDYCSSKKIKSSLKMAPSFKMIKSAVDIFAFHTNPETVKNLGLKDDKIRAVGFTGAEPCLEFDTLIKSAKYIRKKYPWLILNISTNATLIDRKKISLIEKLGINISVSMDGMKEINDNHRKFSDTPEISVWDTVNNNLRKLNKKSIKSFIALATFTPQTIHAAVNTAETLTKMGFGSVSMNLDVYGNWSAKGMGELKKTLKIFKQKYLWNFFSNIRSGNYHPDCFFECRLKNTDKSTPFLQPLEMSLSPDGYFYPCDVLCVHSAKNYRAGNFKTGINFKKFEKTYLKASKFLAKYPNSNNVLSAMARYYYALIRGKSIHKFMENAEKIGKLFSKEFKSIIEIENIFNKLNRHANFGDFIHNPKYVSKKEIKEIKIKISECDLSSVRKAVDFFIYSPGKTKQLFLLTEKDDDQDIKSICAYLMHKTEYIKKELSISIESGSLVPSERLENFLMTHKIKFGKVYTPKTNILGNKFKKTELFYAIIRIDSKNILNVSRIIKRYFSLNDQPLKIELSNHFSWKDNDLVKLEKELKKIRPLILKKCAHLRNQRFINFTAPSKTVDFQSSIVINKDGDFIYPNFLKPLKIKDFDRLFNLQTSTTPEANPNLNNGQKAKTLFSKWTSQTSKEIAYIALLKPVKIKKSDSKNTLQSRLFANIRDD